MNRLTPRMRRTGLILAVVLPLLVLPALRMAGRSQSLHPLVRNAAEIARALRAQAIAGEATATAGSSTEVFNRLVQRGKVREKLFYVPGFQPLKRRPNGDGVLMREENCFALVGGLPESAPARTPLLLWDPDLREKGETGKILLKSPRWLSVDVAGKVSLQNPEWLKRASGSDLLPAVPGEQRLLRP